MMLPISLFPNVDTCIRVVNAQIVSRSQLMYHVDICIYYYITMNMHYYYYKYMVKDSRKIQSNIATKINMNID